MYCLLVLAVGPATVVCSLASTLFLFVLISATAVARKLSVPDPAVLPSKASIVSPVGLYGVKLTVVPCDVLPLF